MNTTQAALAIFGASGLSWLLGRLHLRATQLKALDRSLHLPDGTLEAKANAAAEAAAQLAAQRLAEKGKP